MISSARNAAPAQMAMSIRLLSSMSSPFAPLQRRQPAFLQGNAIECLALPADEQQLVALEHLRTRLVRLDHYVMRPAVVVLHPRARRITGGGAAGDDLC